MSLINCKECGKEISDKATVCPACGFENKLTICPKCHKEMSKTVNFCPHCGFKSGGSLLITIFIIICSSIYSLVSIYAIYNAIKSFVVNIDLADDLLIYFYYYSHIICLEIMRICVLWLTFAYVKTQKRFLSVISFISIILSLFVWSIYLFVWYFNDFGSLIFFDLIYTTAENYIIPVVICLFGLLFVRRIKS